MGYTIFKDGDDGGDYLDLDRVIELLQEHRDKIRGINVRMHRAEKPSVSRDYKEFEVKGPESITVWFNVRDLH